MMCCCPFKFIPLTGGDLSSFGHPSKLLSIFLLSLQYVCKIQPTMMKNPYSYSADKCFYAGGGIRLKRKNNDDSLDLYVFVADQF